MYLMLEWISMNEVLSHTYKYPTYKKKLGTVFVRLRIKFCLKYHTT